MTNFSALRLMLLISFIVTTILAIVSIAVGAYPYGDSLKASLAFVIIGWLLILSAFVLYVILFFICQDKTHVFMMIIAILTGIAFGCFLISVAVAHANYSGVFADWILGAVWTSALTFACALLFKFLE